FRSLSIVTANNVIITGSSTTITLWTMPGTLWLREKTTTNEKRYKDSGITQSSGTGVMSVVIKAVTPSMKLEGTNASPTHRSLPSSRGLLCAGGAHSSAGTAIGSTKSVKSAITK